MAIRISSVIQNGGRDDDRLSGFLKPANIALLLGGMPVTQAVDASGAGKLLAPFDGTAAISGANIFPLGLAIEPTSGFPNIAANGDTGAGLGFDTQDYAKGGVYSVFHRPGNLVDVYDDERNRNQVNLAAIGGGSQNASCPFLANLNYAVGETVYATAISAVTNCSYLANTGSTPGSASFGVIRSVTNAGLSSPVLTIELHIAKI